jgi:hypothetical protein
MEGSGPGSLEINKDFYPGDPKSYGSSGSGPDPDREYFKQCWGTVNFGADPDPDPRIRTSD